MAYAKQFDPRPVETFRAAAPPEEVPIRRAGDRAAGSVYVYADNIVLAVNVALATDRPLLIRGASGSGKSSLAANVAASSAGGTWRRSSHRGPRPVIWSGPLTP